MQTIYVEGSRRLIALLLAAMLAPSGVLAKTYRAQTPSETVNALYRWHFAANAHEPGGWSDPAQVALAMPLFSPGFYHDLQLVLVRQRRSHEAILDYDPFVDAQIEAIGATSGHVTTRGATSTVDVLIRYRRIAKPHAIKVVLIWRAGDWRVDDIVSPVAGSLRKVLAADLRAPTRMPNR